ncbi:MAG: permease of the major facilitator superfamily [Marmoricola sp.]|nr:permease of the major facilitator superfamily [Marmoricola sp.]
MRDGRPRLHRLVLVAVAAVLIGLGWPTESFASPPRPARSAQDDDGLLQISASPRSPWFTNLAPGEPRYWSVTAWLEGAEHAALSLRLLGSGELVSERDLRISVHRCTREYPITESRVRPRCPGREVMVVPDQPLRLVSRPTTDEGAGSWRLPDLVGDRRERLLVSIGLPAEAAGDRSSTSASATFGVGLYATDDGALTGGASTSQEPWTALSPIPGTGGPALGLLILGMGSLAAGTLLVRRRRPCGG